MTDLNLSRRTLLAGAAALPLGAAVGAPAIAAGHAGPKNSMQHSFAIGDFEVSTLLAGTRTVEDDPQGIFGMNVGADEFKAVSDANFIPSDKSQFFFTPTVVRTGSEVVLFDTGLNAGGITAALDQAGLTPEDITIVVITHMHGDHIGGLMNEGTATFPNARYVTGQVEYDHWAAAGNERFDGMVKPLAEKMSFIGDGGSVVSGITGVAAFGHTPGHMGYMLESNGEQLFLMADLANHYVWSLAYPDWEVRFDMDKAGAAASRKKVLGMAAADKFPLVGYHMPFPGVGYVTTEGPGAFHYVPATYQLML
ncbi:MAG: MBL fold metallo-hydrolase [Paracoccaceae bacterium]|uniref:MBL fold metallo-hydrolase n=1 Tax=Sulfitobacter pontiacus TaxID=60137 RepID=UPI0032690EFC